MKKNLLLAALVFCMVFNVKATQYMVMVSNYSFSPSSFTMHLGDTILWMWNNGSHTTTSTSVPTGATIWGSNISSSATTYMYVPSKTGAYSYQCNYHYAAPYYMTGTFTVLSPSEVPSVTLMPVVNIYPSPTAGQVHLQFSQAGIPASVTITDVAGKKILSRTYNDVKDADLDLKEVSNGVYIISVEQGNFANRQELIVSH